MEDGLEPFLLMFFHNEPLGFSASPPGAFVVRRCFYSVRVLPVPRWWVFSASLLGQRFFFFYFSDSDSFFRFFGVYRFASLKFECWVPL